MRFGPAERIEGTYTPPADKSISHRAAIVAAMGRGKTAIENYLRSADTEATLAAVEAVGAAVTRRARADGARTDVEIEGVGLKGAKQPGGEIDVGNSGTLIRLLPGWLAAQEGRTFELDGDSSVRARPMDRIVTPLNAMGANISAREGRFPPLEVDGSALKGTVYKLPVASAQVKSCILLAGLNAEGETTVIEPLPSRDHTERMLRQAGVPVAGEDIAEGHSLTVSAASEIALGRARVPNDISSAAFLVVAATLVPRSRITVEDVGLNWSRCGLLAVMRRMGATIDGGVESRESASPDGEPVGDLEVSSAALTGTEVGAVEVPLLIDELPLVALMGCFAEGETVITGARELRAKETDRITTVVEGLRGLGAEIEELPDGLAVTGSGGLTGGVIDSHGDHRIAMTGAVAGLASQLGVEVVNMEAAAASYPRFTDDLAALTST